MALAKLEGEREGVLGQWRGLQLVAGAEVGAVAAGGPRGPDLGQRPPTALTDTPVS